MRYPSVLTIGAFLAVQQVFAQSVVINEFRNQTPDVVEIVVVDADLDLRGMIVKDFSTSGNNDGGRAFTFTTDALWSSVRAGTIIVLRNDATAADTTTGGADFNLDVGLQNATYFTAGAGTFDIATDDILMIKASGSATAGIVGSIHAFAGSTTAGGGTNFAAIAAPKLRVSSGNTQSGESAEATNPTQALADFNGTSALGDGATGSIGTWNNADNQAFIVGLRGAVDPVTNVQFTAASASAGEASVSYTVTVYKSLAEGDVSGEVGLSGTATEGVSDDYTIDTTNFTMNGATTSATFTITINDDAEVEGAEAVVLTLANVTGGTVASPSAFTLTLTDNDVAPFSGQVWINEINYDPPGTDAGEFVEVAGAAGTDLGAYTLVLYNGSGGASYATVALSGVLDDEGCGVGALSFATAGIQNGAPDGVALVHVEGGVTTVVQFLSYEGAFTAADGPAASQLSTDIGVLQNNAEPTVQLQGSGTNYTAFTWTNGVASGGSLNDGQTIDPCTPPGDSPPILAAIGNKAALTNATLTFVVTATPTDSDPVTLIASNLPGGAQFFATNQAGSFHWASPGPVGVYTVGFYAADNDGVDSETITITVTSTPAGPAPVANVWINELHYDNVGGDTNEGFEVAGSAGVNLADYRLVLYDGTGFLQYSNRPLSGTIPNETNGIGAIWFDYSNAAGTGVQNGPDGVALVHVAGAVTTLVQFLSYEGAFTAGDGPANGVLSEDIGVAESGTTAIDHSAQLCGTGTNYAQIVASGGWVITDNSHNLINACQDIPAGGGDPNDVDGDGIPDDWETTFLGSTTNAPYDDADGDGYPNIEEFVAFTDPANSNSFLRAAAVTNGSIVVVVPSVTGRSYRLVSSPLLPVQAWTNVIAGPVAGTGGNVALNGGGAETNASLRVRVQMTEP